MGITWQCFNFLKFLLPICCLIQETPLSLFLKLRLTSQAQVLFGWEQLLCGHRCFMCSYTGVIYIYTFGYVKIAVTQTTFSAKKVYAKLEQWINGLLLPWGLWFQCFIILIFFSPPNNYSLVWVAFCQCVQQTKPSFPALEQWFWRCVCFKAVLATESFSAYSFSLSLVS